LRRFDTVAVVTDSAGLFTDRFTLSIKLYRDQDEREVRDWGFKPGQFSGPQPRTTILKSIKSFRNQQNWRAH
jgi:hypothetical protein